MSALKPASEEQPVSRHIIALLTFIGLLPLVYYIPPFIADNISDNHLLVTVLAVAFIVPVISYVWLPLVIRCIITNR